MYTNKDAIEPQLLAALEAGEELRARARARDAALAITDQRVLVAANERLALNVRFEGLRRIQFDIERSRPATMVIVPEQRHDEPQVLAIDPDDYESAAQALALIGRRLAGIS
jgi:hypothetical protein